MPSTRIELRTRDGVCPAHVFRPDGSGPWPGTILYMDGPGIRPALFEIAEEVARHGYLVLMPDLFYRLGGSKPEEVPRIFTEPEFRATWMKTYLPSASLLNVRSDTEAFLEWLAASPDVREGGVGTFGYCMGGGHALTAAGLHPDRVIAAASYHGGGLATDAPESPHRLAPSIRAKLYIAGADKDPLFPEDMKARLDAALTEAGVDFVLETYAGQRHGFAPPDTPVHTKEAGERHFRSLLGLFAETLKP